MSNIVLHRLNPRTSYRCDADEPLLLLTTPQAKRGAEHERNKSQQQQPTAQSEQHEGNGPLHCHDVRTCSACLRSGIHTIVTSTEQLTAFVESGDATFSPGSPTQHQQAANDIDATTRRSSLHCIALESDCNGYDILQHPLRWVLFIDRSADVFFDPRRPEQRSNFLALPGGDPMPPMQRVVPGYVFEKAGVEPCHMLTLAPVVLDESAMPNSPSKKDEQADMLLDIAARALADLQDLALLSRCDRALHLLQGQVVTFSGVSFYVLDTVPTGCMVRVGDETQLSLSEPMTRNAIAGWVPPRVVDAGGATTRLSMLADGAISSSPQQQQQPQQAAAAYRQDAATSPIVVVRPVPKVPQQQQQQQDDDILSAPSPSMSPKSAASRGMSLSPPQQQAEDMGPPTWTRRFADLNRMWAVKFKHNNSAVTTPEEIINDVANLAAACADLQLANNNAAAFLLRHNIHASRLMYTIPTKLREPGQNEVILIMHPDPDQACLALELAGVRVAECWATPGGAALNTASGTNASPDRSSAAVRPLDSRPSIAEIHSQQTAGWARCCYAIVTPASRQALDKIFASGTSSSRTEVTFSGTVNVLGEPRIVTRLDHSALDDIHRMLEWHDDNVSRLVEDLARRVDWCFIMEQWGSQLATLVRDVRTELAEGLRTAEASNIAFHELEAALEGFRAATATTTAAQQKQRALESLSKEAVNKQLSTQRLTSNKQQHQQSSSDNSNSSEHQRHLREVLEMLTHAVAHEVAGEEDRAAQFGILDLWPVFEMLGTAYEMVVSRVREFRSKLLVSRLEDGEVSGASLRSLYQGAVFACREAADLDDSRRIVSVRGGDVEQNARLIAKERLERLVMGAQEIDVFAGAPLAELWLSDVRCFHEFLEVVRGEVTAEDQQEQVREAVRTSTVTSTSFAQQRHRGFEPEEIDEGHVAALNVAVPVPVAAGSRSSSTTRGALPPQAAAAGGGRASSATASSSFHSEDHPDL